MLSYVVLLLLLVLFLIGTGGEFSVFCLCEAVWLLLVVDWLKWELLCSGKLHGLWGEYKHLVLASVVWASACVLTSCCFC